jgi:stage III sporulation protein AA
MNIEKMTFLPGRLIREISNLLTDKCLLEEIRIRKNKNAYIIVSGKNILIDVIINDKEMLDIVKSITHNSIYAFKETLLNGYISFDDSIRIGVIGCAKIENDKLIGIYDINEIAIRIPNNINVDVSEIIDIAREYSVLFYSPPGVGKTTLLKSLIRELSSGREARRLCAIDTREELLSVNNDKCSLCSFLRGYPRNKGIEIAVRTMNAQLIVCDEIGDFNDSKSLLEAQGAGVPIIATCHGSSVDNILSHIGIREIHKSHIFDYYIGIKRGNKNDFVYNINSWGEVNDHI